MITRNAEGNDVACSPCPSVSKYTNSDSNRRWKKGRTVVLLGPLRIRDVRLLFWDVEDVAEEDATGWTGGVGQAVWVASMTDVRLDQDEEEKSEREDGDRG